MQKIAYKGLNQDKLEIFNCCNLNTSVNDDMLSEEPGKDLM